MKRAWREIDRILRGEATRTGNLARGTIEVEPKHVGPLMLILAMSYGLCMGVYSLLTPHRINYMQLVASSLKVPALLALTILVTLPSLYVFNALVGSRLTFPALIRLLIAFLAILVAVLASLGPIVAFFSVSTTSYSFMVLLNVVVFTIAGVLGLLFLLQTLHRLSLIPQTSLPQTQHADTVDPDAEKGPGIGPLDRESERAISRNVTLVFRFWVILFGVVGAQMSWILRPFIGNPDRPFTWFRARDSNFFMAVAEAFSSLFS